jgi:8-oxo-dGTP pyrophosphatase MutT (NUDIX family)
VNGNGWTRCSLGHAHWGLFGAAGLLAYTRDRHGQVHVLLQHRGYRTAPGGTWGIFGGARHRWETAETAALREAAEESTLSPDIVRIRETFRDDHGGWTYDTVLGELPTAHPVEPASRETLAAAWFPATQVGSPHLHPGFAATWPDLVPLIGDHAPRPRHGPVRPVTTGKERAG